jgi:hypothetical protein
MKRRGRVLVRNGMSGGIKKKIFAVINLVCKRGKTALKYYVRCDAYVTKLVGFGTGIEQHIYGQMYRCTCHI